MLRLRGLRLATGFVTDLVALLGSGALLLGHADASAAMAVGHGREGDFALEALGHGREDHACSVAEGGSSGQSHHDCGAEGSIDTGHLGLLGCGGEFCARVTRE